MALTQNTPDKTGNVTTIGAQTKELVGIPIGNQVAGVILNVTVLGVDRANTSQTVTFAQGGGGGINAGVITLLPNLFGGASKSLSLVTANVTVSLTNNIMTVSVTGVAGKTIDWIGRISMLVMEV